MNSSLIMDISVFDNNSSDDTISLVKKKFPEVEVHEIGINMGFGKANNLGLKIALEKEYDYAFLLNQDAWIEADTVQKLIESHNNNNKNYGVIVPLQMNGEGTLIDSLFLKYTIANNRELITNIFRGDGNRLQTIDFANAACWLVPISIIKKIGGFDPLFPHYGEDDDYLNRLKRHHLKVGMEISTAVFHDRENRIPKTSMKAVVNECFTRELIDFKNPFIPLISRGTIFKKASKSGLKFITSGFNRYYLYKIIAYFKIWKIYNAIMDHRSQETKLYRHYLS